MAVSNNLRTIDVSKKGSPFKTGLVTGGGAGLTLILLTGTIGTLSLLLISDIRAGNQLTGLGTLAAIGLSYVVMWLVKKAMTARGFPSPSTIGNVVGFITGCFAGFIALFFLSAILTMLVTFTLAIL